MAIIASSSSLQFSNAFPSSTSLPTSKSKPPYLVCRRALDSENNTTETPSQPESELPSSSSSSSDPENFENRLAQVRLRYKSGTGKKAEVRKGKKSKKSSSSGSNGGGSSVLLPPVPLKEPVSGGMKVELGFTRYSERLNGRMAGLGLTALLLVELATGKSLLNYHTPSIVFIQIYFIAAVSAMFVKLEKEKVSIWPQ